MTMTPLVENALGLLPSWRSLLRGSPAPGQGGVCQIFTVPSQLAEAGYLPSGLNATLSTQRV
jgi:hypothetical protein